jgi:hypothetical protein
VVEVTRPDAEANNLIERAYRAGEKMGISVWGLDQAGPFQTMPYPGTSWNYRASRRASPIST